MKVLHDCYLSTSFLATHAFPDMELIRKGTIDHLDKAIEQWDFNSLALTEDELLMATFLIFQKMGLFDSLPIQIETM